MDEIRRNDSRLSGQFQYDIFPRYLRYIERYRAFGPVVGFAARRSLVAATIFLEGIPIDSFTVTKKKKGKGKNNPLN